MKEKVPFMQEEEVPDWQIAMKAKVTISRTLETTRTCEALLSQGQVLQAEIMPKPIADHMA